MQPSDLEYVYNKGLEYARAKRVRAALADVDGAVTTPSFGADLVWLFKNSDTKPARAILIAAADVQVDAIAAELATYGVSDKDA